MNQAKATCRAGNCAVAFLLHGNLSETEGEETLKPTYRRNGHLEPATLRGPIYARYTLEETCLQFVPQYGLGHEKPSYLLGPKSDSGHDDDPFAFSEEMEVLEFDDNGDG